MAGKRSGVVQWPSKEDLRHAKKRLGRFDPITASELRREVKPTTGVISDTVIAEALHQRIDAQLAQLLAALDVDQSKPDKWEQGFLRLAVIYLGAGHVKGRVGGAARKRESWTDEQQTDFMEAFLTLKSLGYSDQQALKQLGLRKYHDRFPYRPKRTESMTGGKGDREEALRKRLGKIRSGGTLLEELRRIFSS